MEPERQDAQMQYLTWCMLVLIMLLSAAVMYKALDDFDKRMKDRIACQNDETKMRDVDGEKKVLAIPE